MKKFPAVLVCGIAAILLTIVLYFTILSNVLLQAIHFIALVAIVLAEGITTVYAWKAKGSPRKVAAAIVTGLMIPFSMILSVVYIVNFPMGYGAYIGWYLGGMILVNLIAFILAQFDSRKIEEDSNLQEAKNNMLELRKLMKSIMADADVQPYTAQLRMLEEKLHFGNDSVIVAEDNNIRLLLLQLQENISDPEFDAAQMIKKLEKTIDARSIVASRTV